MREGSTEKILAVMEFITECNPDVGDLTMDEDLIDGRAIDSLTFVRLILFLEELGGTPIDLGDVTMDDLRTLRGIDERFLTDTADR